MQVEIHQKMVEQTRNPTEEEMKIFMEAQQNLDKTLCEKIEQMDYRDSCVRVVDQLINESS